MLKELFINLILWPVCEL